MRALAVGLFLMLGGCVYSQETYVPPADASPLKLAETAALAPAFTVLTAALPHAPSEGLAPSVLDALTEGVPVRLDLTLMPPLEPSFVQANGAYVPAGACDFGAVPASAMSVPTGSYHMLLDVELGSRESHPANLLSCEYDPALLGEDGPAAKWRLRGCFLPLQVSIPTAAVWALNPLPASACGIGD